MSVYSQHTLALRPNCRAFTAEAMRARGIQPPHMTLDEALASIPSPPPVKTEYQMMREELDIPGFLK